MNIKTINDLTALPSRSGLGYFCYLLDQSGITESNKITNVAHHTMALLKSQGKKGLKAHRDLIELEERWYQSLRIKKQPDYSVYNEKIYLAEVWCCWDFYAKKYIKDILTPKLVPEKGIKQYIDRMGVILDLGNGIGFSTAAFKQHFPKHLVIGTNVQDSYQWTLNVLLSKNYNYELLDPDALEKNRIYPVELTFASEYFEHFEKPVEHLSYILEKSKTKILVAANAFGADSCGHFDSYIHKGKSYDSKAIGRIFGKELKENGYRKIKTKLWNSRPSIWIKDG
tara:strand:- start:337 stop:1185 length:849 start_codon:yes stop_codon:yes gene_type:complete